MHGESDYLRRIARTFVAGQCDKYQNLMSGLTLCLLAANFVTC